MDIVYRAIRHPDASRFDRVTDAAAVPGVALMNAFIKGLRARLHGPRRAPGARQKMRSRSRTITRPPRATLVDAIESLTEAFALFDADDRLVLCNSRYVEAFTRFHRFEDIAGMGFEELVRCSIAKGEVIPREHVHDVDAWVAERVRRHRNPTGEPSELELGGGRWLQVTERHTKSGGIVGVRQDITARKQLEQRQAMEHAVTRVLAQSESVSEALPAVIETMCESLGWDCGARWRWDPTGRVLRCAQSWAWHEGSLRFLAASAQQTYARPRNPA
jgi:PAS domain-containing protein